MRVFLFLAILLTVQLSWGQCWNPDSNNDGFINTSDLLSFLGVFDNEYNALCDSTTCSNACNNLDSIAYHNYYYPIVAIGDQCWFAENLRTVKYANNELLLYVTDNTEWANTTDGAVSFYDNNPIYYDLYGGLYNWYAVNSSKGLCPSGWHVPTDAEWKELEAELQMPYNEIDNGAWRGTDQGAQLKTVGEWNASGLIGYNTVGFSALPGGRRNSTGPFAAITNSAWFWSTTGSTSRYYRYLDYNSSKIYRSSYSLTYGLSVRCLKD